jgi:hypothetical protein
MVLTRQLISSKRALALAVLLALGVLAGCGGEEITSKYPPFQRNLEVQRQLIQNITLPVGHDDAANIVGYYLKHYHKDTMLPAGMVEEPTYWKVQLMSYTTGAMLEGYLRIDKQTGGVSGFRPVVRDIPDLLSR